MSTPGHPWPGQTTTSVHAPSSDDHRDDASLMCRIANNDTEALRELYDLHGQLAYSIAYNVCHQSVDAQEVVAAVFCELWKNAERFHPQRGSFRTYLIVLSRSRAMDFVRSSDKRRKARLDAMPDLQSIAANHQNASDPSRQLEESDQYLQVRQQLDALPSEFALVLRLAFFRGMTHEQIAKELGQPLGTIKSRIRRGMEKFREQWIVFGQGAE